MAIQVRDSGEGLVLLAGLSGVGTSHVGLVAWWTMKLAGIGPVELSSLFCSRQNEQETNRMSSNDTGKAEALGLSLQVMSGPKSLCQEAVAKQMTNHCS